MKSQNQSVGAWKERGHAHPQEFAAFVAARVGG